MPSLDTSLTPIHYGRQHITPEDEQAVIEALRSDFLTQGPRIFEFETAFTEYIGSKHAVAVSNGTAALHLCALALGVKEGDNVITSPITFVASANCVRYCGGNIYFTDIDPKTYTLDPEKVRELIASKPAGFFKGIIPVDFAGHPADLQAFRQIADEHGLWIIEDACHSPGGVLADNEGVSHRCGDGSLADLAIFSFHPVKHIATGEGGMVTTNNPELYQKLLKLRTHGITKDPDLLQVNEGGWWYEMQELGYNYRLPDVLAALGISQLTRAEENIALRRGIATGYNVAFSQNPNILTPFAEDRVAHAYHLYVIQVEGRKRVYDELRAKGIFTQVHYIPVHYMPYYQGLGHKRGDYPIAEAYYERALSLPMYPTLSEAQQEVVIEQVNGLTTV